jgi:Skp family chaperone for outer membrane proteins
MSSNPSVTVIRIAEIDLELAAMKDDFFSRGIQRPLNDRTKLEHERAQLKLKKLNVDAAKQTQRQTINRRRNEILQAKLTELGFPTLVDECNAKAEKDFS